MVHHALVHRDVGVAGHTEQAGMLRRTLAEHRGRVMGDEFLHKGKAGRLSVLDE